MFVDSQLKISAKLWSECCIGLCQVNSKKKKSRSGVFEEKQSKDFYFVFIFFSCFVSTSMAIRVKAGTIQSILIA
jgi:hypothetical protein